MHGARRLLARRDQPTRDTVDVRIRFADVSIDVDAHELRRAGDLVDVQPQVFAVLIHLIEQRDRVVPKEELLDRVWQHRFVTESALTSRIKSARQAIGDNGRDQRMIRTVHGTGYRFIAAVDQVDDSSAVQHRDERPAPARVHVPAQSTPFVGRAGEIRSVIAILGEPDCRLLTILGPGGMGKTRLAIAVAEELAPEYPDGVWFVSLAAVTDAAQMVYAVADALSLLVDTGHDPVAQLVTLVAAKRMLVVLDNLEQLDDVGLIADIVGGAPGVRLLATSRERLHLQAEWIFELRGMDSPDAGSATDADAVELFVGAARRRSAGFTTDGGDAAAVRRICQMLGGMPLAIELAAGWTQLLSVADIADELERGFELLETDLLDIPERHRSMRAVLDGSWGQLTSDERQVFIRLSVFRDGMTRAAAEVVAGANLPLMRRLIGASMVTAAHDDRYQVHELLRQYGELRLIESGTEGEVRERHSQYFLTWLADRADPLRCGAQRVALEDIAVDFSNVRAAWSAAVEQGRFDTIGRSVEALWHFADTRGTAGDMDLLVRQALAAAGPDAPVVPTALLRCAHGSALAQRGALEAGRAMLQQGVGELTSAIDDRSREMALAHLWHGWVSFLLARNSEAATHAQHSLTAFVALGDRWGIARCHFVIGNNDTALGLLVTADDALRASLAAAEAIEDRRGVALACRNLSILAGWFGRDDEASALIGRALSISREFDDRLGAAYALRELGKVLTAQGDTAESIETLRRSIDITDDIENRWESAATADDLGNALAAAGELDAAEVEITRCLRAAERSGHRYFVARCTGDLGALALRRGDLAAAETFLLDALSRWNEFGHEPYAAWTLVQLGRTVAHARAEDARQRYAAALDLALRHELAPIALDAIVRAVQLGVPFEAADRRTMLELASDDPAGDHATRQAARTELSRLGSEAGAAHIEETAGVERPTTWRDAAKAVADHLGSQQQASR